MDYPDPVDQYRCLVKHFFERFFNLETVAVPQFEKNILLIQVLALLGSLGFLSSLFLIVGHYVATLEDKCFFISLSMILLGLVAVFEWETLFPDRKDYLVLAPLPIRTRTFFLAKTSAIAAFLLTFTIAINLCPTFLYPLGVLARRPIPLIKCVQCVASHGISVILCSVFVFLLAIAIQGTFLMLLPRRIGLLLSPYVRFFFFLLLLCALFTFPGLSSLDQSVHSGALITIFYPPIWFLGIYEFLLGSRDPVWWSMALRALAALILSGILSVLTYAACYRRFMSKGIELSAPSLLRPVVFRIRLDSLINQCLLRNSDERALFHFIGQILFRSPRHKLYIGSFLAVGFSIAGAVLIGITYGDDQAIIPYLNIAILSVPLVMTFFLLIGTRVSFDVPVDLESNWLFRLAPRPLANLCHAGIRKYLFYCMILPFFLFAGLLYSFIWDWRSILLHVFYGLTLSMLLVEVLLFRFAKIPFACSYMPKTAKRVFVWPFYMLGFAFYGYAAAGLESWLLANFHRFLCFHAFAGVALFFLIYHSALGEKQFLRFEEESEIAPVYLDLRN